MAVTECKISSKIEIEKQTQINKNKKNLNSIIEK